MNNHITHLTRDTSTRQRFSFTETLLHFSPLQRIAAFIFVTIMLVSGTSYAHETVKRHLVDMPRAGGTYREAVIGTPRFINPVLAVSSADRDLVALLYAGLMSRDGTGVLVPQLAETYTVSDDGGTYTFTLRKDAVFHDGTPITSADVAFTIEQVQNPGLRSPQFSSWENVTVETPDDHTIVITLPEPYAPFIENTTLGILPRHIWEPLADDQFSFSALNTKPVGAGPYQIKQVVVDASGIPTRYELEAFRSYVYGTPNITRVHLLLYPSRIEAFEAYRAREVHAVHGIPAPDVAALLQTNSDGRTAVLHAPQLRVFGIFLNQNKQPLFLDKRIREALSESISKDELIEQVFHGYATPLTAPMLLDANTESVSTTTTADDRPNTTTGATGVERARKMLEDDGWTRTEDDPIYTRTKDEETKRLSITLSTVNTPDMVAVAELVSRTWREVGAEVELKVYETADQSVIRPRRHEALLFGMELGHELDLYAFWHSSQRNDPGLNISQYANLESDTMLETLRTTFDTQERTTLLRSFAERLAEDHAAIFLFAPDLLYLSHADVHNITLHPLADPSERFHSIHEWYMETDRVWPLIKDLLD